MYDARKISSMLQFMGGKPMLTLRDHTNGRIKVFKGERVDRDRRSRQHLDD